MQGFDGKRLLEFIDNSLDLDFGPIVGCFQSGVFVGVDVGDDGKATSAVIEDEDDVGDEEDHVRQAEVVWWGLGKGGLEVAHHVVGEVTDGTAAEDGKRGRTVRAIGAHEFFESFEGVAIDCEAAFSAAFNDFDLASPGGDDGTG